jgi:hypothetical protein
MARLYISEYGTIAALPATANGQVPFEPPIREQVIDFTGGVATSQPFQQYTRMIRLNCDATCSILIGPAGSTSASTSNGRWATNQTEFRGVPEGQGFVVSVIGNV